MTSKILKSILTAALAVLLTSLIVVTAVLYAHFGILQQNQLKDELSLATGATEQLGLAYLEDLDYDSYRLTWVSPEGAVLFDSHASTQTMDNHAGREEIREALISGSGSSSRKSTTLTQQTLYEARRLADGSVLRISVSRAGALVLMLGMLLPLALIIVGAVVLSTWLARRMAKAVVEPLNSLDLDNPMDNSAYEELSPLLHRIHTQQQQIRSQMGQLRRKQEEFEQITANMNEALVLLDDSERILSINPAAKALFGADEHCLDGDFLAVDRGQDMRLALKETRSAGSHAFRRKKNGRDYQFDLSRIDSEGRSRGIVILAFDITEQLNGEKNRREFSANVSHELKTPLQSIIGSAELMENGIVKPEDIPRFVGHIRKEGERLLCLIDDIIRLSQLDEEAEMPRTDVSLRAVAREVCESLADLAKHKNVSFELSGDEGRINGVRRLMYELIYNLCENAVKYNKPGGKVSISILQKQGGVCLQVADTGIGIAPEHQDKVFERFYRVDKSHSKQSGGTGLGLSIVKHAVQYHHGNLKLESQIDKGTTVSVLFET